MASKRKHIFTVSQLDAIQERAIYRIDQGEIYREELARAALAASAATGAGQCPPHSNTGGKGIPARLVLGDGSVKEVPARRGWGGDAAFLDWVNFTCHEESFFWNEGSTVPVSDDQLMAEISLACERLYGFGITTKREQGANFYKQSWVLGDGYGMVCYGGQRNTVLITLNGQGCAAARDGWEKRLYDFLNVAKRAVITRCDLSFDDYDGSYSVDRADSDFDLGLFDCGGRTPDIEHRGNWKQPSGKGRTVYVGHRENGKFLRVYEKGKQLGGKSSPWVRVEGQLGSRDRIIPFDVLLRVGEYLAAMYPALAWISQRQERIFTKQKTAQIGYQKTLDWLHRQCGAALWAMSQIEGSVEALYNKIKREGVIPPALRVADWRQCEGPFLHTVPV